LKYIEIPSEYGMLELVAVDLTNRLNSTPLRIILAYRPPGYSCEDNKLFFNAREYLVHDCARACVLGEFNSPEFQWSSYAHPNTELYNLASKFICNNGLHQFVEVPTREKNILDIVLCSDVLACDNVDVSAVHL